MYFKNISYCVPWDKALAFMLKWDEYGVPYTLQIDRHKRAILVIHIEDYMNGIKDPKKDRKNGDI